MRLTPAIGDQFVPARDGQDLRARDGQDLRLLQPVSNSEIENGQGLLCNNTETGRGVKG